MQLHLESANQHAVTSYSDSEVTVNGTKFQQSLIIGKNELITDWSLNVVADLGLENVHAFLSLKPEIILIGHRQAKMEQIPFEVISYLSTQRIGIECMSIGAAIRTFNILLNEDRAVVLGILQ